MPVHVRPQHRVVVDDFDWTSFDKADTPASGVDSVALRSSEEERRSPNRLNQIVRFLSITAFTLGAAWLIVRLADEESWRSGSGWGRQLFLQHVPDARLQDPALFVTKRDRSQLLSHAELMSRLLVEPMPLPASDRNRQLAMSAYVCAVDEACRGNDRDQRSVRLQQAAISFLAIRARAGDVRAAREMCVLPVMLSNSVESFSTTLRACAWGHYIAPADAATSRYRNILFSDPRLLGLTLLNM